jgi:hypothetical protein
MTDLSDAEWLKSLRDHYGAKHICLYRPQDGGVPWRSAADWEARGLIGVYLVE